MIKLPDEIAEAMARARWSAATEDQIRWDWLSAEAQAHSAMLVQTAFADTAVQAWFSGVIRAAWIAGLLASDKVCSGEYPFSHDALTVGQVNNLIAAYLSTLGAE